MKEHIMEERLLSAWLAVSSGVRNNRLVKSMSFNEIFTCHILYNKECDSLITATDIVERTGMLKSQVNKVLNDLEKRGYVVRVAYANDKRKLSVILTDEGEKAYTAEHKEIINLISNVCKQLGDTKADKATETLENLANIMREIGEKNGSNNN